MSLIPDLKVQLKNNLAITTDLAFPVRTVYQFPVISLTRPPRVPDL